MRRMRILIGGLFACLMMLVACIGTGLGLFYLDEPASDAEKADIVVDDIEENYALKDNNQQASWFDVYFFVQEGAADFDGNPLDHTPIQADNYGYWESSELADGVTADDATYGWRKITVYRSISMDEFNSIGHPMTTAVDSHGWTFGFSGWTADRQACRDCIDHRQGDFEYVDAYSSLTLIDLSDEDGSEAGDGVIYLYPIFTTGKDYDKATSEQQTIVELLDNVRYDEDNSSSDGELFFSQEGEYNTSTYRYNNLTVTQEDLDSDRYSLRISQLSGGGIEDEGFWWFHSYTSQPTNGWSGAWYTCPDTLFYLPGTYNITAKVFMDASNYGLSRADGASTDPGDFSQDIIEEYYGTIDQFIESEDEVTVNAIIMYDIDSSYCPFFAYVLIERVYEFHLMGGPYETFDYDDPSVSCFYDGDISRAVTPFRPEKESSPPPMGSITSTSMLQDGPSRTVTSAHLETILTPIQLPVFSRPTCSPSMHRT